MFGCAHRSCVTIVPLHKDYVHSKSCLAPVFCVVFWGARTNAKPTDVFNFLTFECVLLYMHSQNEMVHVFLSLFLPPSLLPSTVFLGFALAFAFSPRTINNTS